MSRSRTINIPNGGTITLPDVEANGVTALGCWVQRSGVARRLPNLGWACRCPYTRNELLEVGP